MNVEPDLIQANDAPTDTLQFSGQAVELVLIEAAAAAEGKRPTFNLVAYTGTPINAGGFYTPVIVELAGVKTLRSQIPILLDHDPSQIIGQGEAKFDSAGIRVNGTVLGEDASARKVLDLARNGFQWQASIGASVVRREFLEAGKRATVNGREVTGPLLIARETVLNEVSFVAIGADQATSAAVAASHQQGSKDMNFESWLKAKGVDIAKIDDSTRAALKAAYDAEIKAANTAQSGTTRSLDEIFAKSKSETDRLDRITEISATMLRDNVSYREEIEASARHAIDNNVAPDTFELTLLRLCRPRTGGLSGRRSGRRDLNNAVVEAAVCQSLHLSHVEKMFSPETLEAADRSFRGGVSLQELLLMVARDNGCDNPSIRGNLENVLRFAFPQNLHASSGFSSMSLPNILSNVMNKTLKEAFLEVESVWREIAEIERTEDLKSFTSHSLTGDLTYEKVGPSGEIKHGSLGEENYSNKADTYAKILAISRADIINDNLGAFKRVPVRMGRGAALAINDVFWAKFLNNSAFFTSGRGNYDDGTDTALDAAGLKKAQELWSLMVDPNGKPLGTTPKILLVPPAQWFSGQTLMTSTNFNSGGAATTELIGNKNIFAGLYKVLKSEYLANSTFTGYSRLAWYLLADPKVMPVIQIAFLYGRETPVIDSADADIDQLGIKIRGYHDFGVELQEYRGGFKFKGEA